MHEIELISDFVEAVLLAHTEGLLSAGEARDAILQYLENNYGISTAIPDGLYDVETHEVFADRAIIDFTKLTAEEVDKIKSFLKEYVPNVVTYKSWNKWEK